MQNQSQPPPPWSYNQPQPSLPPAPWSPTPPAQAPWMTAGQYMDMQLQAAGMYTQAAPQTKGYATFWRRFAAYLLDTVLIFVFFFGVGVAGGVFGDPEAMADAADGFSASGSVLNVISNLIIAFWVIGFTAFGGTPGKRAVGIRITNREGNAPGLALAIIRQWLWVVAALFQIMLYVAVRSGNGSTSTLEAVSLGIQILWILGCFSIFWTQHNQAVHDKFAGTYVIRT